MARDLGRLRIERLIVHEIPRRMAGATGALALSQIDSPLTQELKNYFKEKISGSLTSASFEVIPDLGSTSPVPGLLGDYFAGAIDFILMSQKLAEHLYTCQTGVNSAGLLVLAHADLATTPAVGVLKLEKEDGVRISQALHQGKSTFSIEHVRQLMLTARTRVFKVGLFGAAPAAPPEPAAQSTIDGAVSDHQRSLHADAGVADFFLRRFLGCCLKEEPEVTTQRFFHETQQFINTEVQDPEAKAQYQIGLLATLGDNSESVAPQAFAQQHLAVADRLRYMTYIAKQEVPITQFPKDTKLIKSQLRRIQLNFESGLALLGKPEVVAQVHMTPLDGGRTKVEFEDKLEKIQGRG